jgi:hypothetical protein
LITFGIEYKATPSNNFISLKMEALEQLSQTLNTFNRSKLNKQEYDLIKQFGFTKSQKSIAAAKAYVTGLIKSNGAINTTPGKKKQEDNKGEIIITDPDQLARIASLLDPHLYSSDSSEDELDIISQPQSQAIQQTNESILDPTPQAEPQSIFEPTTIEQPIRQPQSQAIQQTNESVIILTPHNITLELQPIMQPIKFPK